MPQSQPPFAVTMIGGGMIAHDQILPSLYQLQRLGKPARPPFERNANLLALLRREGS